MTSPIAAYGRQLIDDEDIAAVVAVLKGDWLTTGPAVAAFESELQRIVEAQHVVACNSGTAALHMAAMALDLEPGDAVIVPSITFVATANVVHMQGAEAVFCDVDAETGLMEPEHLQAAVARARAAGLRPRAAIPVHLAGQPCDMVGLAAIAAAENIVLIEDACHAIGSRYGNGGGHMVPVGRCDHSLMACFSFHPVKTVTTGEGGAVTTNDERIASKLRRSRDHGITREAAGFTQSDMAVAADGSVNVWYYELGGLGLNYRLSDINCALGLSQLKKLPSFLAARRALVALYDRALQPLAPVVLPPARQDLCDPGWHLYSVRIAFEGLAIDRNALMKALRQAGIGTQVHYIPVHRQPYYARHETHTVLPGADAYYSSTLSLPLHPGVTPADVGQVVQTLQHLVK